MYFLLVASLWNADRQTSSQGHLHKWCQVLVMKLGLMANLLKRRFYSVHIPYRERPLFPSFGFVRQAESRGRFLLWRHNNSTHCAVLGSVDLYSPIRRLSKMWSERQELPRSEVELQMTGLDTNLKDLGLLQSSKKTFSANVSREHQAGEMLREGKFSTVLSFRQEMGSGWGRRRDPARSPEGLSLWNLNNGSM